MRNISQANLLSVRVPLSTPNQQACVVAGRAAALERSARMRRQLDSAKMRSRILRRALLAVAFSGRLASPSAGTVIEGMAGV